MKDRDGVGAGWGVITMPTPGGDDSGRAVRRLRRARAVRQLRGGARAPLPCRPLPASRRKPVRYEWCCVATSDDDTHIHANPSSCCRAERASRVSVPAGERACRNFRVGGALARSWVDRVSTIAQMELFGIGVAADVRVGSGRRVRARLGRTIGAVLLGWLFWRAL
jgi:hypothetical protein